MPIRTLGDLTQDVLTELGLVTGSAVQLYTEPVVQHYINIAFDHFYRDRYWSAVSDWYTITLSGVTGRADENISAIKQWTDFDLSSFCITSDNSEDKIPTAVGTEWRTATGSRPLYKRPIPRSSVNKDKRVQFYPLTSAATVMVYARVHPKTNSKFDNENDEIPLDSGMIMHGAAWFALSNDGINPAGVERERILMDAAYQQILKSEGNDVIGSGVHPWQHRMLNV